MNSARWVLRSVGVVSLFLACAPAVASGSDQTSQVAEVDSVSSVAAPTPSTQPQSVGDGAAQAATRSKRSSGRGGIALSNIYQAGGRNVGLVGDRIYVRGVVQPFVSGQSMQVVFYRDGRRFQVKHAPINGAGGKGMFKASIRTSRPGTITVRAFHTPTAKQQAFSAGTTRFEAVRPIAGYGAGGLRVKLLQSRLAAMHYAVSNSGRFDGATGRAVTAWRKVNGKKRVSTASRSVFRAIVHGRGAFRVRYPRHGRHVEADLSRQVVALIYGGQVHRVYTTSSGAPATRTPRGHFHFTHHTAGVNSLGMVDSVYFFVDGYAIHGYPDVPNYNASHGCLRIPVPNARYVYNWIHDGDRIDVYA